MRHHDFAQVKRQAGQRLGGLLQVSLQPDLSIEPIARIACCGFFVQPTRAAVVTRAVAKSVVDFMAFMSSKE